MVVKMVAIIEDLSDVWGLVFKSNKTRKLRHAVIVIYRYDWRRARIMEL